MNYFAEILAPAGSFESMRAAVLCGADAVYFGVEELNARRSAENFSLDNLAQTVRFCHAHGAKAYLTLNTLIGDDEIKTAYNIIKCTCAAGIDALILQDFAAVEIVKSAAPNMPIHASTQMSVQTLEGINALYEAGFSRAVIPRELSKKEIEFLCKHSPIELEMFVHGALCMSVSGQCLLSAMLGSRSGNRGACAQPCRLPFSADNSGSCDLSLKDLSLTRHLEELSRMGVASFKIEGRMKRPEYVAAAVTACKNAVEGKNDEEILKDLKAVFSRTGFTDGYYCSQLGKDMFGTRRKEDVVSAAPIFKKLSRLYEKERSTFGVDFEFIAKLNSDVILKAKCGDKSAVVKGDFIVREALNKPLTEASVAEQLKKSGGTQFYVANIKTEIDENVNVPVSVINKLRRDAFDIIENEIAKAPVKECVEFNISLPRHNAEKPKLICRFASEEQIPESTQGIDEIILPVNAIKNRTDVSAELPRGIFGRSDALSKRLNELKRLGIISAWAGTLDGMELAKKAELEINAGFGSNIFNSLALEHYKNYSVKKALLSVELTLNQIDRLGGSLERGVFAYGRVPLMLTRNCPVKNKKTCAQCNRTGTLTDRKNTVFPVDCSSGCSEILNSRPVYTADRLREIHNVDFLLLYFTTESKQEVERIISSYKNDSSPKGEFTRGLLYRGVE